MVKLNKIYTRTGDDGSTGLVDGSRLPKSAPRMAAIGEVDELNSLIGVAALHADGVLLGQLRMIQNDLFDLGADLATPGTDFEPSEMVLRMVATQVDRLETEIDAMNADMTPLTSFILPGGSPLAATPHVARSAARRAERAMVLAAENAAINPLALTWINRVSDWLFVAARHANDGGRADVLWVPGGSRQV
jgi:cob(I)alamin adenosyltransferase